MKQIATLIMLVCFVRINATDFLIPSNIVFDGEKIWNVPLSKELPQKFINVVKKAVNQVEKTAIINEFIDRFLMELNKFMIDIRIDPMILPNITKEFPLGQMELTKGSLSDLSSLTRENDVKITYNNQTIRCGLPVKFENMRISYDYKAKLLGFAPEGEVESDAKNSTFRVDISIDLQKIQMKQNKFQYNLGHIDVKFAGGDIPEIVSNILVSVVRLLCNGIFKFLMQRIVQGGFLAIVNLFNEVMADILAPL